MGEFGPPSHLSPSGGPTLAPLTSREELGYLQGAAGFFLVGALCMDSIVFGIVVPEVLFVVGSIYLAGAVSEHRMGRALFIGSIAVSAAALGLFVAGVLTVGSSLYYPVLLVEAPYVPAVFAPIVGSHALVFAYMGTRPEIRRPGPSILIGAGSIALVIVAITALLTAGEEPVLPSFYFIPIGYALVTLGAWREARHLRSGPHPG